MHGPRAAQRGLDPAVHSPDRPAVRPIAPAARFADTDADWLGVSRCSRQADPAALSAESALPCPGRFLCRDFAPPAAASSSIHDSPPPGALFRKTLPWR